MCLIITPVMANASTTLDVTTDQSQYIPGQSVSITGHVGEIVQFESIKFTITNSQGVIISNGNLFPIDDTFKTDVFITTVNPNYGTYEVGVKYSNETSSTTFEVIKVVHDVEPHITKKLLVGTDKSLYHLNDKLVISGQVSGYDIYNGVVKITFLDGINNTLSITGLQNGQKHLSTNGISVQYQLAVVPDMDGKFSISDNLTSHLFSIGNYTVVTKYDSLITTSSFEISGQKVIAIKDDIEKSITFKTSKELYKIGEKLRIIGHVPVNHNNHYDNGGALVVPERVTVKVFDDTFPFKLHNESKVYPIGDNGKFYTSFELTSLVYQNNTSYTVKVSYDDITEKQEFNIN